MRDCLPLLQVENVPVGGLIGLGLTPERIGLNASQENLFAGSRAFWVKRIVLFANALLRNSKE